MTLQPSRARMLAQALPAGPPPITMTSKLLASLISCPKRVGLSLLDLGVPHTSQFGFKEFPKNFIHFQQSGPRQLNCAVVPIQQFIFFEPFIDWLKFLPD